MTALQGKIAVAATVILLTVLLLRAAAATGNWVGFAVTELQIVVAMAVSWSILAAPRRHP